MRRALPPLPDSLPRVLRQFGKAELRPGQAELIRRAVASVSALGVLPTGHGKSLCYQVAAELLGGTSLVVSPLIALMRDQVRALHEAGISCARFDSTLDEAERTAVLHQLRNGEVRLLFVAPESLDTPALQEALATVDLQLFVVDEAHCVSEWGHSFRPDYLKLPLWWRRCGFRSVLALTATATPRVQLDLCRAFGIAEQDVVSLSPYRENITRRVRVLEASETLAPNVAAFLQSPQNRPAIVYARTRKGTEHLAAELSRLGVSCACYHAGQPAELREQLQDDFLHNRVTVLVATIAFGMGIDKPDVRSVVHANAPSSPEAYIQESGRAGRDGKPATSLVLLQGVDLVDAANRVEAARPDAECVLRCVRWLVPPLRRVVSLWELGTTCDVADDVPMRALDRLHALGAVEVESRGSRFYKVRPLFPMASILEGRDELEVARLRWLDTHREGEVEAAAEAWNCTFAEAMEQLRECEAAGEWKLTLRQQALCLHTTGDVDVRAVASELSAAFDARREADLQRLRRLVQMLTQGGCVNAALEQYFTGRPLPTHCGCCEFCCNSAQRLLIPPYESPPPPECPLEAPMPDFARDDQRRRFLLGLASPSLMAKRLWAHPLYGSRSGARWQDV